MKIWPSARLAPSPFQALPRQRRGGVTAAKSSIRYGSPSYWVSVVGDVRADGASPADDGVSPLSLRPRDEAQLVSAGADAAGASAGVCSELVSALVPMQFVELGHRMMYSGLVSAQVPMQSVERMLVEGEAA